MEIVKAYQTSKGTFLSREKAEKRKNRETYGYTANDRDLWEKAVEVMLLKSGDLYFKLDRTSVKQKTNIN